MCGHGGVSHCGALSDRWLGPVVGGLAPILFIFPVRPSQFVAVTNIFLSRFLGQGNPSRELALSEIAEKPCREKIFRLEWQILVRKTPPKQSELKLFNNKEEGKIAGNLVMAGRKTY